MTNPEWQELIELYVDDALPEALRERIDARLSSDPAAAHDAATLRDAAARLHQAPAEMPASWFVERALCGLLREHADATTVTETMIKTARS